MGLEGCWTGGTFIPVRELRVHLEEGAVMSNWVFTYFILSWDWLGSFSVTGYRDGKLIVTRVANIQYRRVHATAIGPYITSKWSWWKSTIIGTSAHGERVLVETQQTPSRDDPRGGPGSTYSFTDSLFRWMAGFLSARDSTFSNRLQEA